MKKIAIIGAGESGTGAALLAAAKGYTVWVSDAGLIADHFKAELESHGISYEENGHSLSHILACEEVIKSPGIPQDAEVVLAVRSHGIPVIGELEFARRFASGRFLLISGTNGKTTTTMLTYHLLKEAGRDAGMAGNVGHSFARMVLQGQHAINVLEVSSFQLDDMYAFRADTAVLLNITPDHLDRYYHHFQNYANAKFRIVQNQHENDNFIYFQDNDVIAKGIVSRDLNMRQWRISMEQEVRNGAYRDQDQMVFVREGEELGRISMEETLLRGPHNMVNVMSAVQACLMEGLTMDEIKKGLATFKAVPHRLEFVAEIRGVKFYNDSKATNVDSTRYALSSFYEPVVWIAGGKDKGNDYRELLHLVKKHVRALVCLGKDNEKLTTFFGPHLPVYDTHAMKEAVGLAFEKAGGGSVVLLSPACASFDLFRNYEDRGDQFKQAVAEIAGQYTNPKVPAS
jgi:UDP-N-acetylmuramoylalanine--D-glutamate ligase